MYNLTGKPSSWPKVLKTDTCWLWLGWINIWGYGILWRKGKRVWLHRLAWERTKGPIPVGMKVLHHCDNPACVNPSHLFLGTDADNMHDKIKKNRQARGEGIGNAKLTVVKVREIKEAIARGLSQRTLARLYKVNHTTISDIGLNRTWREVV